MHDPTRDEVRAAALARHEAIQARFAHVPAKVPTPAQVAAREANTLDALRRQASRTAMSRSTSWVTVTNVLATARTSEKLRGWDAPVAAHDETRVPFQMVQSGTITRPPGTPEGARLSGKFHRGFRAIGTPEPEHTPLTKAEARRRKAARQAASRFDNGNPKEGS